MSNVFEFQIKVTSYYIDFQISLSSTFNWILQNSRYQINHSSGSLERIRNPFFSNNDFYSGITSIYTIKINVKKTLLRQDSSLERKEEKSERVVVVFRTSLLVIVYQTI